MNMAKKLRQQLGVDQGKQQEFNIQYAHNGHNMLVVFPMPINHLQLTPQQTDDMIRALTEGKKELLRHQEANRV